MRHMALVLIAGLSFTAAAVAGCGGQESDSHQIPASQESGAGSGFAPRATSAPAATAVARPGAAGPAGAPGSSGAKGVPDANGGYYGQGVTPPASPGNLTDGKQTGEASALDQAIAGAAQDRVIIRTVDLRLTVPGVQTAIELISRLAGASGGWVVSSSMSSPHKGGISIRVPAGRVDSVAEELRRLSVEPALESSTSQDFTEEFTDNQSALKNLRAQEDALRALFIRAEKIEDAIKIQAEISKVTAQIEKLEGRTNFLSQSAAFSLINITLAATSRPITVDAGQDVAQGVGDRVQFKAVFPDVEGIDQWQALWDFGDGTDPVVVTRTALRAGSGDRASAPVSHNYYDDADSPYIVSVKVTGTGDGGVVEGTDTLIATVGRIPVIELFVSSPVEVDEGKAAELEAAFTRPEALARLEDAWDFGDGAAPATGVLAAGVTAVSVKHVYPNHRPAPYTAVLTLKGKSQAGAAEAQGRVQVTVRESKGWVIGGWSASDTGRDAVRALSVIAQGLLAAVIWLAVLSPLWLAALGIGFVLVRRERRTREARNLKARQLAASANPLP